MGFLLCVGPLIVRLYLLGILALLDFGMVDLLGFCLLLGLLLFDACFIEEFCVGFGDVSFVGFVLLELLVVYMCIGGFLSLWSLGWLTLGIVRFIGPINVRLEVWGFLSCWILGRQIFWFLFAVGLVLV